jgi:indolepyruvate ferredoxin oxidoreductase beta subunit
MTDFLTEPKICFDGDDHEVTNVLFVGVGGQGIIVASKILSEVMLSAGLDVKKSEVHGMAQRGGSVVSEVRFGTRVYSPLIRKGECDMMVSFEQLETLRYLDYLHDHSIVILNSQRILPPSVSMGLEAYPGDIPERVRKQCKRTILLDGLDLATQAGNVRTLNMVLLGALSPYLPIYEKVWESKLRLLFPPPFRALNIRGFRLGREFTCARRLPYERFCRN